MPSPMPQDMMNTAINEFLIPVRIDELAVSEPDAQYAEVPVSPSTYEKGFKVVTFSQLSNAVNGAAYWLERNLGRGKNFETLTYAGPNDLRYPILALGAVKAGYKLLLTSPRNSVAAHVNLFKLLECSNMITSDPPPQHVASILQSFEMQVFQIPELIDLLENKQPHYPYNKTFEKAKSEPLVVIHTSGSTGLPKPIIVPHEFATRYSNITQAIPPRGTESQSRYFHRVRLVQTLPLFHAAGIYFGLVSTIFNRTIFIHLKSGSPPSGEGLVEALKYTKANAAFVSPSIIEEISKNSTLLDAISQNLETLVYSGGDLPQPLGDAVASRVRLFSLYGSTEIAQGVQLASIPDRDIRDWKYHHFDEKLLGMQFRHRSEDLYELVIVKDPKYIDYQTPFTILTDVDEFSTKDLFSPHPTIPGLWRHKGRSDDIIVFLNGEKTNPVSMEGHIASHLEVKSALVVGAQRLQAALLIELNELRNLTPKERAQAIERIWPTISEANLDCPAHAKIDKDHILFVQPEKPVLRAGKGTIIRLATLKLYEEELDKLYDDADNLSHSTFEHTDVVITDLESLESHIGKVIKTITARTTFSMSDDFFALGMDSLQVIQLTRALRMDLKLQDIPMSTVYSHSSISALAQAIFGNLEIGKSQNIAQNFDLEVEATLRKYTQAIDDIAKSREKESLPRIDQINTAGHHVLLTGSTGALGSYLLHTLLKNPRIAHIYCLNRSQNSLSLQKARNQSRKLPDDFSIDRVTFLTGDLSTSQFGLEKTLYSLLISNVTLVIHSAWIVNFNLTLPSYSNQLAGVTGLIAFSAATLHTVSILYISSISSVQNFSGKVPEKIITDPSAPANMGYGQSKHIAERLLSHATTTLGISAGVARVGQIAGPANLGHGWNADEWLPSLVKSSKYLGAIPESLGSLNIEEAGEIDWVPIDQLAEVLIELALNLAQSGILDPKEARVFHPLNPSRTSWKSLIPAIVEALNSYGGESQNEPPGSPISIVSFSKWTKILQDSDPVTSDNKDMEELLSINPALKLVKFYEDMESGRTGARVSMETKITEEVSEKMRALECIQPDWVKRWVDNWFH